MRFEITNKQSGSRNCFVCGKDNPGGLFAEFYETKTNEVISLITTSIGHQSYPEHTHGGVICAILDETAGRAVWSVDPGSLAVTASIEIKYYRPVPLGEQFLAVGKVETNSTRWYKSIGRIYDKEGNLLAESKGVYVKQKKTEISESNAMEDVNIFVPDETPLTYVDWNIND